MRPERFPLIDDVQTVLRMFSRMFVSQSVGTIGLLWCLADDHPYIALVLAILVLADQALFLRARFFASEERIPWRKQLLVWCLGVTFVHLLIVFSVFYRAEGLRLEQGEQLVSGSLDCLAFSLASFLRVDLGLVPASGLGRLLAAIEAGLGTVAILATGAALLTAMLYRRSTPVEPAVASLDENAQHWSEDETLEPEEPG